MAPDDLRCTAISAKTGERCSGWAVKSTLGVEGVEPRCSGHSGTPAEALRRGRKAQAAAAREEAERVRLRGIEGQLRDAEAKLAAVDVLDVAAFTEALTLKQQKELELERLRREQAVKDAEKLQPPTTPGFTYRRSYTAPGHKSPDGAILDPETGETFVWAAHPAQTINSPRRAGALDPDLQRLRDERQTPLDVEEARRLEREERALHERVAECARAPHAASVYGAPLGLDAAEYLDYLDAQLRDLHGTPVDLNADPNAAPEFEAAILPVIQWKAERESWSPTRPLRVIG
jgi:hypothetical protein